MYHSSRMIKGSAEDDLKCGSSTSEGKNISKWLGDCSCDMLTNNMASFLPHPENPLESKLKNFGLMVLSAIIDSVPWLVVTLMQISNEKQADQGKLRNVQFEEKSTRKCNVGSKSSAEGDEKFF